MSRHRQFRCLVVVGAVLLLGAGLASADDRELLRTTGGAPNVFVITDSGGTTNYEAWLNRLSFVASGDDDGRYANYMYDAWNAMLAQESPATDLVALFDSLDPSDFVWDESAVKNFLRQGSKQYQIKQAFKYLFDAGFDFNFGMSYFEKGGLSYMYYDFAYTPKSMVDLDGDGTAETPQAGMLDGTRAGDPIRMGSDGDFNTPNQAKSPIFPIRYGVGGDEEYILWDSGAAAVSTGWQRLPYYGVKWKAVPPNPLTSTSLRLRSFLVTDRTGATRKTYNAAPYYYPAYNWSALPQNIKDGLTSDKTWAEVNTAMGWTHDLSNTAGNIAFRNAVLAILNANQIGSRTLFVKEVLEQYNTVSRTWVATGTSKVTELAYQQHFIIHDAPVDPPDMDQEDRGMLADALTPCVPGDVGCGETAYRDRKDIDGQNNVPLFPISQPDAGTGGTEPDIDGIRTALEPETTPIFYFPALYDPSDYDTAKGETTPFRPQVRDSDYKIESGAWIPMTETIPSVGRRPIGKAIENAGVYFTDYVLDWEDPLAACRDNFIILLTDGLETCTGGFDSPMAKADTLYRNTDQRVHIYIIYFGNPAILEAMDATDAVSGVATATDGDWFAVADQEGLRDALMSIAYDIEERTRGFASPIVPSVETTTQQTAYISTFTPFQDRSVYRGHMRAYPIDPSTGTIANLGPGGVPTTSLAAWDAGDTLAIRDASSRTMYFGLNRGVSNAIDDIPGTRATFDYLDATVADPTLGLTKRQTLGWLTLGISPWLVDLDSDATTPDEEDPDNVARLDTVRNFIRGVRQQVTLDGDGNVVSIDEPGRPFSAYGWCGNTGDYNEADDTAVLPCRLDGASELGVEKLGDIFHSTPQLMAAPRCYACWRTNYKGYARDDPDTVAVEPGFFNVHRHRRQVIFVGADDGTFHAFDAGLWDDDGGVDILGNTVDASYDFGTGYELFAWVPTGVMRTLETISTTVQHEWTVDGTPTVADVFIDPAHDGTPTDSDREWRTVAIFGERRGGRSYVALDVTQPDPYDSTTGEPTILGDVGFDAGDTQDQDPMTEFASRNVGCVAGTETDCDGAWPALLWEFFDTSNDDADRNGDGIQDNFETDLGQTWARPLVGFVKIDHDNDATNDPQTRMVAIFGGGFTPNLSGIRVWPSLETGNFVYAVDIETGQILLKKRVDGMVPSEVSALDLNVDGFLEKLYFGTTKGKIYKIDLSTPARLTAGRVHDDDWDPVLIFDTEQGIVQPFFVRPTLVPVTADATGNVTIALCIGSGDRDNIFDHNAVPHRFYVILDKAPAAGYPITETAHLTTPGHFVDLNSAAVAASSNWLIGTADSRGWYLKLYDSTAGVNNWEKVNTAALVLNQYVIFSTFNPAPPDADPDPSDPLASCRRRGNARTYVVYLYNGNPQPGEDRYEDHPSPTAMATEPVVYLGADGRVHVIQALDNLRLEEPVAATDVPVRVMTWKEE